MNVKIPIDTVKYLIFKNGLPDTFIFNLIFIKFLKWDFYKVNY